MYLRGLIKEILKIPVGLGGYDGTLSPSRTGFDSRAGRLFSFVI